MRCVIVVVLLFLIHPLLAQKKPYKGFPSLVWPKLYDITFKKDQDEMGEFSTPIFSDGVKNLNNKIISVPGYMVPFENGVKSNHFMLSSLPLNACFFCGVGGPETVIEIFLKNEVPYSEKPVEVRGRLQLNDSDPDKMIYVLQEAEVTGAPGF